MSRKLTLVPALGLALVVVAACDQQPSMGGPDAPVYAPAPTSPTAAPLMTPSVAASGSRATWPIRSGLNSDPDNPSGAPGPNSTISIVR